MGQPDRPVPLWRLLYLAALEWDRDNAMRLSAAVAMYSILSLSPLLVITLKVLALVFGPHVAAAAVHRQTRDLLGQRGADAVAQMVTDTLRPDAGLLATAVSVGIVLFTASGVFSELRDSLNSIFDVAPKGGSGVLRAIRSRLLSIGMVFVVGFLLLVSQFVTTALTLLSEHLAGEAGSLSVAIDLTASTLLITLLFAMVFRFLPDVRLSWRDVAVGSVVTAVLFKFGQYLQALYFTYGSTASAYGAAGSFVVILLWVYYSCWIVFYGAELIAVYQQERGRRVRPSADAVAVPENSLVPPKVE